MEKLLPYVEPDFINPSLGDDDNGMGIRRPLVFLLITCLYDERHVRCTLLETTCPRCFDDNQVSKWD